MKYSLIRIISIITLVAMFLSGCGISVLSDEDNDKRQWGSSAEYESYVAYVVGGYIDDGFNSIVIDLDIKPKDSTGDEKAPKEGDPKEIEYDGKKYSTVYYNSYKSQYGTRIDCYKSKDIFTGGSFWISRSTGKIVSIYFYDGFEKAMKELADVNYYYSFLSLKEESFYIEIAKKALEPLVDVSGYNVRYDPIAYGHDECTVYFELIKNGYMLTRAIAHLSPSGVVIKLETECDYDWSSVEVPEIDKESVEAALLSRLTEACSKNEVSLKGYKTRLERIVPDENGRLAVLYWVRPELNETSEHNPVHMCSSELRIYIE